MRGWSAWIIPRSRPRFRGCPRQSSLLTRGRRPAPRQGTVACARSGPERRRPWQRKRQVNASREHNVMRVWLLDAVPPHPTPTLARLLWAGGDAARHPFIGPVPPP